MDPVYEAAVKRLDELQKEVAPLKEFVDLYRRTRHQLGLDGIEAQETNSEPSTKLKPKKRVLIRKKPSAITRTSPRPEEVVAHAIVVLSEAGRPLSRRQIYDRLAAKGVRVEGSDPIKALGTMLWRANKRLVQLDGFGYWIKDRP